jgi:hypothetical protein
MQMLRQKLERLRRIPKTVQEENSMRIPLLHVDRFSAGPDSR